MKAFVILLPMKKSITTLKEYRMWSTIIITFGLFATLKKNKKEKGNNKKENSNTSFEK
jgi:hypothetical protein